MTKKCGRFAWLRKFSVMFLLASLGLLACFAVQNKHLVGELDAVHQHFPTLAYIRSIFHSLFSGDGFKMVNLQIGQGFDTIGTLSYYGLADPLNWIAALFPERLLEYAYGLIIFLRLYLVGLTFGCYLRVIGLKDDWALSLSAFVYTFCGFFLKATLRHPYFSDGGIYLALMLIATERLLKERKWLMFTLTTALMLAANYYFAFQTTLLVIIYILMRLVFRFGRRGLKGTAADGFSLMGAYILGAMLIAAYFLPVLDSFLGNARMDSIGVEAESLLHYAPGYYLKLILFFCAPYMTTGPWMHENFIPIALFGLIMLFTARGKGDKLKNQLRCAFIIVLLMACVPAVGKLFNGMSYVSNRWCYGFAFVVCAALAWALPGLMDREQGRIRRTAVIALCYALVMLAGSLYTEFMIMLAGAVALAGFSIFLLVYDRVPGIKKETAMRLLALATVGCCIIYQAMIYLPLGGSFAEDYGEGAFAAKLGNETAAAALEIDDDGFSRVDSGLWDDCHQLLHDYNGTAMYWSVVPAHVSTHYLDLQLSTQYYVNRVSGMGGSTIIDALASTGYALRDREENRVLPYGYEKIDEILQDDGDTVDIYKNDHTLPVGYVYDETMSAGQYRALNPVDKQAALMQYAVVENGDDAAFESPLAECAWRFVSAENAAFEDGVITVEKGGSLNFEIEGAADAETYMVFENLRTPEPLDTDGVTVYFDSDAGRNIGRVSDPSSNYHFAQAGVAVNLGYSESGITRCTVTFTAGGEFLFDSLRVYALPMDFYRTEVQQRLDNAMRDIRIENNSISGSVSLESDGVLQISVPYGKGWTAKVDGGESEILLCGGMYMGIELPAGEHSIELNYFTPGLRTGAVVSAVAVAVIIVLLLCRKKKK